MSISYEEQESTQVLEPALYMVATPIGNLRDITLRALDVLRAADIIYAEDTRVSAKLCQVYGITAPLRSCREAMPTHQFAKAANEVVEAIGEGKIVAFISDAGTPGVSDPGNRLVSEVRAAKMRVVPIPGASALTAALSVLGFAAQKTLFVGFLPKKKGHQTMMRSMASQLQNDVDAIVLYESPERLLKFLTELKEYTPNNICIVLREITKRFEDIAVGNLDSLITKYSQGAVKGECVVVITSQLS